MGLLPSGLPSLTWPWLSKLVLGGVLARQGLCQHHLALAAGPVFLLAHGDEAHEPAHAELQKLRAGLCPATAGQEAATSAVGDLEHPGVALPDTIPRTDAVPPSRRFISMFTVVHCPIALNLMLPISNVIFQGSYYSGLDLLLFLAVIEDSSGGLSLI